MAETVAAHLESNLAALAWHSPGLVRRLSLSTSAEHVVPAASGATAIQVHGSLVPLSVSSHAAAGWLGRIPLAANRVHVLGAGLGECIDLLLGDRPDCRVRVWERDPHLLALALGRFNWGAALASGRLDLRLGVDGLSDLENLASAHCCEHPVLGQLYPEEAHVVEQSQHRQVPKRWVGLVSGGLYISDLAQDLVRRGFGVFPIEPQRWSLEEIESSLQRMRPELVIAVNYTGGLAEICRQVGCRLAVWEIDPSTDRAPQVTGPSDHVVVHTYRKQQVAAFRSAGFSDVQHRTLAASPETRKPVDQLPRLGPARLSFVGSSMVREGRTFRRSFLDAYCDWHSSGESARPAAIRQVDGALQDQRATPLHYRLPALLGTNFRSFLADCEKQGSSQDPQLWLAETAAAECRLSLVASLGDLGMQVWGDAGWRLAEPHGVRWMGPAGHRFELNTIYSSSAINVDIGRLYQGDIVTMRVFDVLACRGFLLAQHSVDLERCFDVGTEIESYSSPEELRSKVRFYQANPHRRERLAAAGLRAVRERHTIAHRMDVILAESGVAA